MEELYCKCQICNKKVLKEMSKCKCDEFYCRNHILNHNCNHDYKSNHVKKLEEVLYKCEKRKIDNI
jgi:hypothetical protein